MRSVSLLLIGCLLSSCATISHGINEVISVDSNPSGANATITCTGNIHQTAATPAHFTIPRKAESCRVDVEKSGMQTQIIQLERGYTSSFWLNFVPASGLGLGIIVAFTNHGSDDTIGGVLLVGLLGGAGFLVDRFTGAMYDHNPNASKSNSSRSNDVDFMRRRKCVPSLCC